MKGLTGLGSRRGRPSNGGKMVMWCGNCCDPRNAWSYDWRWTFLRKQRMNIRWTTFDVLQAATQRQEVTNAQNWNMSVKLVTKAKESIHPDKKTVSLPSRRVKFRLSSIVLVKLAYWAPSTAQKFGNYARTSLFSKLCLDCKTVVFFCERERRTIFERKAGASEKTARENGKRR